jgi:hypothetical protein
LLDGRGDQTFHPLFAKKSGEEHAELNGTKSQEIHQLIQILLRERPPVGWRLSGSVDSPGERSKRSSL